MTWALSNQRTSTSTRKFRNVVPTEFEIGILAGELPVDGAPGGVPRALPGIDFTLQCLRIRNAAIRALAADRPSARRPRTDRSCRCGRTHTSCLAAVCAAMASAARWSISCRLFSSMQITGQSHCNGLAYSASKSYMRLRYSSVRLPMHPHQPPPGLEIVSLSMGADSGGAGYRSHGLRHRGRRDRCIDEKRLQLIGHGRAACAMAAQSPRPVPESSWSPSFAERPASLASSTRC